jgi:c-di-GMP-related signal transduction protein
VLVARQPILDTARRVFGYELLFRASAEATSCDAASERASARVITDALLTFGLDTLTGGRPAFINITRNLLLDGVSPMLPPGRVVLELLEDIGGDPDVIATCEALRKTGYAIALDDFVPTAENAALVPLADYVKVDFRSSLDAETRRELARSPAMRRVALIAEKVETAEECDAAIREGFSFLQGHFFGKPAIQSARDIPDHQLGCLKLLRALHQPGLTVSGLEDLIKHDVSLCYRVLRVVNSAGYGLRSEVDSIRQALVLLGLERVRRWASLWLLAGLNQGAHPELVTMATVRARCTEVLSIETAGQEAGAQGFLLGMGSMLGTILERPIEVVASQLPLTAETKAALLGDQNPSRLRLDCVIAYERGDWTVCAETARLANVDPTLLPRAHAEALQWSRKLD